MRASLCPVAAGACGVYGTCVGLIHAATPWRNNADLLAADRQLPGVKRNASRFLFAYATLLVNVDRINLQPEEVPL
jgi:hypothetical protein